MGGTERFDGEEHNGSNRLAGFAAVWPENRHEMVAANGGSCLFMAGIQGQRVVEFWSAEDGDAFGGGDQR